MKNQNILFGKKGLRWMQSVIFLCAILYFGRALFIPLSFALLVSFILYPICTWLEHHKFPRSLAIAAGLFLITLLLISLVFLLGAQVVQFQKEWPTLSPKLFESLERLSLFITQRFEITKVSQNEWFRNSLGRVISFLGLSLFNSSASIVLALLIPVFSALILYQRKMLAEVLLHFFPIENRKQVISVLNKSIHTYYNFIKGMLLVYLIVGLLNSIGLLALGIPHSFMFGFIASILTFIPYVGIIIASLLPITFAWLTKDSIWYPVGVIAIFSFVQYLEANIIFPLTVSNRLKINSLVTILVMIAGGILWGAAGMILFIPFAAIIKLIADELNPEGPLAIIMGQGNK